MIFIVLQDGYATFKNNLGAALPVRTFIALILCSFSEFQLELAHVILKSQIMKADGSFHHCKYQHEVQFPYFSKTLLQSSRFVTYRTT